MVGQQTGFPICFHLHPGESIVGVWLRVPFDSSRLDVEPTMLVCPLENWCLLYSDKTRSRLIITGRAYSART